MLNQKTNEKAKQVNISAETFKGLQEELSKMISVVFDELSTKDYQIWLNNFMVKQRGILKVQEYLKESSNLSEIEYHNIRVLIDLPEFIEKLSVEQKVPNGSWRINERMNYNIKIIDNFYNMVVQKKDTDVEVVLESIKPCAIYVNIPCFA